MVVTQAAPAAKARAGLRQIDLHRDLRPIADLIDEAFAGELDAAGRSSLNEMRTLARMGPLLYLMLPVGGEMGGFFRGFVWEADGQIVGNVTIQQLDGYGQRWMIANVAVRRAYRGRGIARALVEAALDRIRQLGGEWALLQVRGDNDIARGLYERMGFSKVVAETSLRSFKTPDVTPSPLPPTTSTRLLHESDDAAVQYLARQVMPELARWWNARRHNDLRRFTDSAVARTWGLISGKGYRQRLGLWVGQELMGMADIDLHPRGEHRLDLLTHPKQSDRWERYLLAHALTYLRAYPDCSITATVCDYQSETRAVFESFGFRATNVLLTMRRRIRNLSEIYT